MRRSILTFVLAAAGALPTLLHAATPAPDAEVARYAARLLAQTYPADGPGVALLVARGDTVLYRGARGEADIDRDVPLRPDSLFRIGSVTKQFVAAALLKLVEDGRVSLDDPIPKYVAGFPGGERVSVRQLLNHTSGIRNFTDIPETLLGDAVHTDVTTRQLIDRFEREPTDFPPGEGFAYSNSGYVLVAAVIEAVTDMPWHRYLETALFEPLGMTDTGYGGAPAISVRQVRGYSLEAGKPKPAPPINMTWAHAAGAMVSTVDDLLRWNRALHEGRVLEDAMYRQMITPEGPAARPDVRYGFGVTHTTLRGRVNLNHSGVINGFLSYVMYLPDSDLTVAVLENSDAGERGGPIAFARRLAAFTVGEPYPEPTPVALGSGELARYEGVYRVDAGTSRVLRVVDGRLTAQRTGGRQVSLVPIGRDEFLYENGFDRFRIERDAAGAITGMRFFADGEGKGTVAKRTDQPLPTAVEPAPAG